MRKIDAFAHILPPRYLEHLERHLASTMSAAQLRYYQEGVFRFDPVISDLDARWRRVEPHGDYAQVLVLAVPPLEEVEPPRAGTDLAQRANDEMAELVRRFPDRFVGFAAALPLSDVDASLAEIDRAVGELGALGVQLFTNVRGAPLDHPRFDPVLARMEALDRTVWLHPTRNATWPDYPTERESDFGIWWSLGWPYETGAALSRLVYSGQMERHPGLRVIAHHGGGMVPHFSARLAMGPGYRQTKDSLPRPAPDYFRRFYADTALFGAPHAVRCVLEFFGHEHLLFGTDTPLGPPDTIEATIADLDAAGLAQQDLAAVYAGNAQRLLGVD
jgi:uncharacterized protein